MRIADFCKRPHVRKPSMFGSMLRDDFRSMRNRLVHTYFDIDPDVVWATATVDLPQSAAHLERRVPSEQP